MSTPQQQMAPCTCQRGSRALPVILDSDDEAKCDVNVQLSQPKAARSGPNMSGDLPRPSMNNTEHMQSSPVILKQERKSPGPNGLPFAPASNAMVKLHMDNNIVSTVERSPAPSPDVQYDDGDDTSSTDETLALDIETRKVRAEAESLGRRIEVKEEVNARGSNVIKVTAQSKAVKAFTLLVKPGDVEKAFVQVHRFLNFRTTVGGRELKGMTIRKWNRILNKVSVYVPGHRALEKSRAIGFKKPAPKQTMAKSKSKVLCCKRKEHK